MREPLRRKRPECRVLTIYSAHCAAAELPQIAEIHRAFDMAIDKAQATVIAQDMANMLQTQIPDNERYTIK